MPDSGLPDDSVPARLRSGNALLDALALALPGPTREDVLQPALEAVSVALNDVVHQAGTLVEHVWFPTSSVFGLLSVLPGASAVEAMPVASEGLVGLAAVLGDGVSPHEARCQVPGQAVRLPTGVLRELYEGNADVRTLLGRYAQVSITLISGRVACSLRHTAEQRCAEWLLRRAYQVGGGSFPLTQQLLASVLGLRRTTVSAVAARLQDLGLIAYRYGQLAVQDHDGLERRACRCYGLFRDELARLAQAAREGPAR